MVSYYNSKDCTRASKVKDKMVMKLLNVIIMVSIIVQIVVLANNSSFSSLSSYHPPSPAPFLLPPSLWSETSQNDAKNKKKNSQVKKFDPLLELGRKIRKLCNRKCKKKLKGAELGMSFAFPNIYILIDKA